MSWILWALTNTCSSHMLCSSEMAVPGISTCACDTPSLVAALLSQSGTAAPPSIHSPSRHTGDKTEPSHGPPAGYTEAKWGMGPLSQSFNYVWTLHEMRRSGFTWCPLSSRVPDGEWKEVCASTWVLSSATESLFGGNFYCLRMAFSGKFFIPRSK